MSNFTIRNGLAIAEILNDDRNLANEVALNLDEKTVDIIVEKATGYPLRTPAAIEPQFDFVESLRNLLDS